MIKVGQVYKLPEGEVGVVIFYDDDKPFVDIFVKYGMGIFTRKDVLEKCQLIAEYPTFTDAVKSKEFKNG